MNTFKPLEGVLIVSIEQALSAPLATCRLCDAGARVIKIEREGGDFARHYDESVKGLSTYFVWANRGKESVVLDIKSPEGRQLFLNMIDKADVFVQNLIPGALKKLGLDSASLHERNPRLITVDISGYGEDGDYASMKAYDNLVQAESGLLDVTGDGEVRAKVGISVADISAGMHAYAAVLEALIQRDKTGIGAQISVSMFDCMADWMMVPYLHQVYGKVTPKRTGLHHAAIAPYGPFKTQTGVLMIGIQNEREWDRFCTVVLNGQILSTNKTYDSNPKRVKNSGELNKIIQSVFSEMTLDEAIRRLKEASIAFAQLNTLEDFSKHSQLRLTRVESEAGDLSIADKPARIKGVEQQFGRIPSVGEHQQKILDEFGTTI
jgi:itaconate CoA-transferase